MKFGFSYATERYTTSLELWETARDAGLDQAWSWDSHVLWQECWSLMGWLIGTVKPDFEFGTCVTNPRTRDPIVTASAFATLNQITDGRMICGIGRGDSSVRVLKRKPANLADVEHADARPEGLGPVGGDELGQGRWHGRQRSGLTATTGGAPPSQPGRPPQRSSGIPLDRSGSPALIWRSLARHRR
mgnify:CR=1 FL=1